MSAARARQRASRSRFGGLALWIGDGSAGSLAQIRQAGWFGLLVLLVTAMSFAHGGAAAKPLFVLAGLYGAAKYRKQSPWLLLTWSFWFWTVTPFVRRIIEWKSGFSGHDPVLVTPNLIQLFMLPAILNAPGLLRRRAVSAGLLILVPTLYGLFNSFFRGEIFPGIVSAADWVAPLLYFFYVALHVDQLDELGPQLRSFLALNLGLLTPYALYQFAYMTPWDQLWLIGSGLATEEQSGAGSVRVFGTFTNPGFLAAWLGFCLVLITHYWTRVQIVLGPIAAILIVLTLSRSVYISTALGFVALLAVNRPRNIVKPAIIALAAMVTAAAVFAVADPEAASRVTDRLTSMTHLQDDTSAQVRKEIWAKTPEEIASAPFGLGIGAIGRGAIASTGGDAVVIDSGLLAIYLALGWLFGTIYLFGMLGMVATTMIAARRSGSTEAGANAAASLVLIGILPFINVGGFGAVILWTSVATALARIERLRLRPRSRPAHQVPIRRTSHA